MSYLNRQVDLGSPKVTARRVAKTYLRLKKRSPDLSNPSLMQLTIKAFYRRRPQSPHKLSEMLERAGDSIALLCLEAYLDKSKAKGFEIDKKMQTSASRIIREELKNYFPIDS